MTPTSHETNLPIITVNITVYDDDTRDLTIRGVINTRLYEFKPSEFRQVVDNPDHHSHPSHCVILGSVALSSLLRLNFSKPTELVMKYTIVRHWIGVIEIDEDTDEETDMEEILVTGKKNISSESMIDELEGLLKINDRP